MIKLSDHSRAASLSASRRKANTEKSQWDIKPIHGKQS
jgi:hypothetical protein